MSLSDWSKDALIQEVLRLREGPLKEIESPKPLKKQIDFQKYAARQVAFKIAYFGWKYHGLSCQEADTVETIESHLFRALEKSKMIPDRKQCRWSRCGRTDKGVCSFGQVVSLTIRSKLPKESEFAVEWPNSTNQSREEEAVGNLEGKVDECNLVKQNFVENTNNNMQTCKLELATEEEYPYLTILNNLLPADIRVVAWSPVSLDFNARFSCQYRHYNYFFNSDNLNIQSMQEAAQKLQGSHDFRNFCKIDPSKKEQTFTRTIIEASIDPIQGDQTHWIFSVKGTAFLWHQVRCMMSILFLIGKGLETPSLIDDLLDISRHPKDSGRPIYEFADDFPLVLVDCGYKPGVLQWSTSEAGRKTSHSFSVFYRQWHELAIKSTIAKRFLNELVVMKQDDQTLHKCTPVTDSGKVKYVPIMSRKRCDSQVERNRKSKTHCKKTKLE